MNNITNDNNNCFTGKRGKSMAVNRTEEGRCKTGALCILVCVCVCVKNLIKHTDKLRL